MKYGELNLGQIEAVVNKLGGMEGLQRFLSGDLVVQECEFPFHPTGELTIHIPALKHPTLPELQAAFPQMRIKEIERDTSPETAVTLNLATILRSKEELVNGEEYERRIAPKLTLLIGFQQAVWLVEHQDDPEAIPNPETRRALKALLGKIYIDFSGLVVVLENGARRVPCLDRSGRRWYLCWGWIVGNFGRGGRIAVSSK